MIPCSTFCLIQSCTVLGLWDFPSPELRSYLFLSDIHSAHWIVKVNVPSGIKSTDQFHLHILFPLFLRKLEVCLVIKRTIKVLLGALANIFRMYIKNVHAPLKILNQQWRSCRVLCQIYSSQPTNLPHVNGLTLVGKEEKKIRKHQIQTWMTNLNDKTCAAVKKFSPSSVSCLDKSISVWSSMFTCPGWMCIPRETNPFGNEYYTICCRKRWHIMAAGISGGKGSMGLQMTEPIWCTGKMVVMNSGFCLQSYYRVKKKRSFWCCFI